MEEWKIYNLWKELIITLNGLPIVLIELKSPSREEAEASNAYKQIRNYLLECNIGILLSYVAKSGENWKFCQVFARFRQ